MIDKLNKYNIKLKNTNNESIEDLTTLQTTILKNRTNNNYTDYIYPKMDIVKDLDKLKDLDKAGELIKKHIDAGNRIALVFDYDCDGINSGAVLYLALTKILNLTPGKNVVTFANRRKDGNGFNPILCNRILDYDKVNKIDLIITSDHASSDEKVIHLFKERDIDFLLTDHHQIPEDNYPKSADVFVNNQRKDSDYSRGVSGCFIAFLTALSAYKSIHNTIDMDKFKIVLPYVAITTISDVMPLNDPINRAIIHNGLIELNSGRNILWNYLKDSLGINTSVDSVEIGFKIAPLINTASRVGAEDIAFNMLIADNENDIRININKLLKLTKYRKVEQKKSYKDAVYQIEELPYKNSIALSITTPLAIGGIISGQVGETYNRPTVCFTKENDEDKVLMGSARGILNNLNLVDVFKDIHQHDDTIFIKFGGHKQAAGCTIHDHKLEDFRKLFDKYVLKQTKNNKSDNYIYIDSYIDNEEIEPSLVKEINRLEPYGKEWSYPYFATIIKLKYYNIYGSMGRFVFKTTKGREIEAIYFFNKDSYYDKDSLLENIRNGDTVLIVFKIVINNFNKKTNLQLNLIDIRTPNE